MKQIRRHKQWVAGVLALVLVLSLGVGLPAAALDPISTQEKADALYELGLFKGKGVLPSGAPNYDLTASATRNEAATMLIRALGKEGEAKAQFAAGQLQNPFTDVPDWAKAVVSWLYASQYVRGTSETTFGGEETVDGAQFATMLLRSLGYSDAEGDFHWESALDFAVSIGLITEQQRNEMNANFHRGDMVELCYNALDLALKGSNQTLREKLASEGVFDPLRTKADILNQMGLFGGKGTNPDGTPDYALSDTATRNEAATMLIRLMGKESKAKAQYAAGALKKAFSDIPDWAAPVVSWLYEGSYVNGTSTTTYGGDEQISAQQFVTMVLRCLGYSDAAGDFSYDGALDFAVSKGLISAQQRADMEARFDRGAMVEICYKALKTNRNDSKLTLQEKLAGDGVFSGRNTNTVANTPPLAIWAKYTGGGSVDRWVMEEKSNSSPVCVDLDGDGNLEILFAIRSIFCLDAATGQTKWSFHSGNDVTNKNGPIFGSPSLPNPIHVVDYDGDGRVNDIVTFMTDFGGNRTFIGVYNSAGYLQRSWITPHLVRAAKVADFDADGKCEVAVGYGTGSDYVPSIMMYNNDGSSRGGWPQVCGFGVYSDAMEAVDIVGNGRNQLVLLFDEEMVAAFDDNGNHVPASGGAYGGIRWRGVPVCENIDHEYRLAEYARNHGGHASGTASEILGPTREDRYCIMGTYGGVTASDMDGDGQKELVFTTMMVDGGEIMRSAVNSFDSANPYFTTFILNTNRTRYKNPSKGFDWTQIPTDVGKSIIPLAAGGINDMKTLDVPYLTPTVADVDWDGNKEILFASYDGKVHCFHLDGTEHGAWPFDLNGRSAWVKSYATPPAVGDVNGDGMPEVVFCTYTDSVQRTQRGKLYVLDFSGKKLAEITVPVFWGHDPNSQEDLHYPNGSRGTPIIADIDNDGRNEIAILTLSAGICAYEVG